MTDTARTDPDFQFKGHGSPPPPNSDFASEAASFPPGGNAKAVEVNAIFWIEAIEGEGEPPTPCNCSTRSWCSSTSTACAGPT